MKQRIIFILESTFNKRDFNRYGFRILLNKGFKVIALDLTPLLSTRYFNEYSPPDPINYKDHYLIYTKKEVSEFILQLKKNDIVICILGVNKKNLFVYDLLNQKAIQFGYLFLGVQPQKNFTLKEKIINLIQNPENMFRIFNLIFKKSEKIDIRPFSFIISGGKKSIKNGNKFISKDTKIIKAHAFDYDRYIEEEMSGQTNHENYNDFVVFLDSYIPYHPDYIHSNIDPYCEPDQYYSELNSFFKFIEDDFKCEVIIAAHPRSKYSGTFKPFNKRKIVINSTPNLVKYSKFVLAHNSSSINYAVLYHKPLIFLTSKYYTLKFQKKIRTIAECFDKDPICISLYNYSNLVSYLSMNVEQYLDYKENYIKESNTPNKYLWDIFLDYCVNLT